MLIRPRAADDLDACVRALALVHAADRYPVDCPADPGAWLSPDGLTGAWVAVDGTVDGTVDGAVDATVAGHVGLVRGVEVVRLFVVPAARGGGLAERLLQTVRAAAGRPLELEVSSEGVAAIAFYERSGWRRVGSGRAAWLNAAGEPALVHRFVSR